MALRTVHFRVWTACLFSIAWASIFSAASLAAPPDELDLVEAVKNRDRATALALLEQHVDVNTPQPDGATALSWASRWDDLEMADLLIRAGANPNKANDYGVTPLSVACTNGSDAMVDKLLQARANPNAALWSGETPLMVCARTGNSAAVRSLLEHGADVNKETRRGQTALMWAAAQKRLEVVRMLIARGANVNATSHLIEGFQPLLYATFGLHEHVPGRQDRRDPKDVHRDPAASKGGFTPLLFAAMHGDLELARTLLEVGADLHSATSDYGNALLVAAAGGHEAVAVFLVNQGADPNVTDGWGLTPLHYAVREGIAVIGMARGRIATDRSWIFPNMPGLLKALLAHRADPNARIGSGFPPYNYPPFARADINNMPLLRQSGATPFLLAAASGDVAAMRTLVEAEANPLLGTQDGVTPLMVAAGLGRLEDRSQAEEARALEAVQLAVELGADVNAADKDGETALHGAAYRGANAIIEFLVSRGARLDPKDRYGQTPLSVAQGDPFRFVDPRDKRYRGLINEHENTAELLVRLGALPVTRSESRNAPAAPANP
jgi:ankyrin repeat protein